jgi:aminopeptidase-like protein
MACLGDQGKFTYKKSRQGASDIDRTVMHVLKNTGDDCEIQDFVPFGYDERQYCSPGFNLPMGCLMRTPHGRFPEYHTSADNLDIVRPHHLGESFSKIMSILHILENNATYLNQTPKCEPQLGKRGLYQMIGGQQDTRTRELAMLWVLNPDGNNSLLDIAERSSLPFEMIKIAADALINCGLLKERPC